MARFAADPTVAAMAQRAYQIAGGAGHVQLPGGGFTKAPGQFAPNPATFLASKQPWTQVSNNQSLLNALRINPIQAPSRDAIYAAAAARATQPGSYGAAVQNGLENAGQFGNIMGLSDEQLQARAAAYASGRSYAGSAYAPGMIMQEGTVTYRNGVPGIMVKYRTAAGDSTEWTPLQ